MFCVMAKLIRDLLILAIGFAVLHWLGIPELVRRELVYIYGSAQGFTGVSF